jgi:hypothetical protein
MRRIGDGELRVIMDAREIEGEKRDEQRMQGGRLDNSPMSLRSTSLLLSLVSICLGRLFLTYLSIIRLDLIQQQSWKQAH